MTRLHLQLALLFQFIVVLALAQEATEPSTSASTTAVQTTAPAPAPAPAPKPKPQKPICKIAADKGLTWLTWNGRTFTKPTTDFTVTLAQLKELREKKMCVYALQACSLMAKKGESAISIETSQDEKVEFNQAAKLYSDPLASLRDLQTLKDSGLFKITVPTYSVLLYDGRYAVYIDGNQATEYTYNESEAEKAMTLFTETLNPTAFNSIPSRTSESSTENTENKIKNIKCWKGKSLADRDKNLKLCTSRMKYNQTCEPSYFVHAEGPFDVCLQGFEGKPNRVLNCVKSNSKAQLKENMAYCKTQLLPGQVCETDLEVHGHEKNEVCVLE